MYILERSYSLHEISAVAEELAAVLKPYKVIALQGEMGAGKTTLVAALAHCLGVTDVVSSPTFSIVNEYAIQGQHTPHLLHLDLYRIEDLDELINIGLEELIDDASGFLFIEWPQIAEGFLPKDTLLMQLEKLDAQQRKLTVRKYFH